MKYAAIGAALIAVTVALHAFVTTAWVDLLIRYFEDESGQWRVKRSVLVLISTVVVLIALHSVEILVWAVAYQWLLPPAELGSFEAALYFSFVTFTTLGYGDITLSEGWRILSGIEALNGLLLVGWTTALLFAIVQRSWKSADAEKTTVSTTRE